MDAKRRPAGSTLADRAAAVLTRCVDSMPAPVRRRLPREVVGFAVLGAVTFAVDLALLAVLREWAGLALPVAVTLAYLTAVALNFTLNRAVTFRSHAPVGRQAARYAVVMVGDYLLTVGATTGLSALGLDFRVARVTAAATVAAFTYAASRWWVFRDRVRPVGEDAQELATSAAAGPPGSPMP